jgi:hypothetical protein
MAAHDELHGTLLRRMTIEDDLLLARLDRNRSEAFTACQTRLTERGIPAVLVDVEHLFDANSPKPSPRAAGPGVVRLKPRTAAEPELAAPARP